MNAWQKYVILLGQGVERLPDGRWLTPSSVADFYGLALDLDIPAEPDPTLP